MKLALGVSILLLSACATVPRAAPDCPPGLQQEAWRAAATEDDRRRLREWRGAWTRALSQARAAGHEAEIAAEGALLDPDAALPDAAPPPGDYRCRTIKLGARGAGNLHFVAYPTFQCRIAAMENGVMHFVKLTGSQRPVGRLHADTDRRMVFLGTLQLGDERGLLDYGRDAERDMVGILERVGERRWRLVFPWPHFESNLDAIELVPRS